MAVTVRLFAALRDAAGTAETQVEPGPLPAVLDDLCRRHGETFRARLAVSTVLIDGDPRRPDEAVAIPDGAEIALLPPVSGGAPTTQPPVVAAVAAVVLMAAALPSGGRVFALAVAAAALVGVAVLAGAFAAAGRRPLLPAAAVGGVGVPLRFAADDATGVDGIPALIGWLLLAAFVLAILSPRRRGVTVAIGVTGACGLLVALGAGGLLLLRGAGHGFRWAGAVLLLVVLPELGTAVAARVRPEARSAARVVVTGMVGGGLLAAANPPFTGAIVVVVLGVALAAAFGAEVLGRALALEAAAVPAGIPAAAESQSPVRWVVAVCLTTAAVQVVAAVTQL